MMVVDEALRDNGATLNHDIIASLLTHSRTSLFRASNVNDYKEITTFTEGMSEDGWLKG